MQSFGKHIKLCRLGKGLTAEQLAEKLDISTKSIWQIESGRRATSLKVLIQLCNELDISPEYFLSADLKPDLREDVRDELMDLLLSLTKSEKEMVKDIVRTLVKNRKKYREL